MRRSEPRGWSGLLAGGPSGGIAIDDADLAPEEPLLHLLNASAEAGCPALLASRTPPARWPIRLADLASRLRAITAVEIGPADDSLLRALLLRLLGERQLAVPQAVQEWLLLRLPRTPEAIREAAARLDRLALALGAKGDARNGSWRSRHLDRRCSVARQWNLHWGGGGHLVRRAAASIGSCMNTTSEPDRTGTELLEDAILDDEADAAATTPAIGRDDPNRFINRELSWLDFNHRVVEEAENARQPLLERLRFVSISASNLDEFYSVRVAGLIGQAKSGITVRSPDGRTPFQQLAELKRRAETLLSDQQRVWSELRGLLNAAGIEVAELDRLTDADVGWLASWFMERVFPVLTPLAIDPAHPFPFIPNMGLVMALRLVREEDGHMMRALLPLPSQIDRFIRLPGGQGGGNIRFVVMEDVLRLFMNRLFPGFGVKGQGMFRLIRDTDVEFEEEAEDWSARTRPRSSAGGEALRSISLCLPPCHEDLRAIVTDEVDATPDEIYIQRGLLGVADVKQLIVDDRPDPLFPPYTPRFPERIRDFGGDCFAAIRAKDIVVHHPFESFDVVVQFLRQAASDPNVVAVKQTLYRTSRDSPIVKALIEVGRGGQVGDGHDRVARAIRRGSEHPARP